LLPRVQLRAVLIVAGSTADDAPAGIGGVDFRVDVGFGFDCSGIGGVNFGVDMGFGLDCSGIGGVDFRVDVGFGFDCSGIGGVDFGVDVGFGLDCSGIGGVDSGVDCSGIGGVDSGVDCSRLLRPRVGVPTLLLVDIGRAISGSESHSELPSLNLVPVNVR
jgi:hypothetical protein